MAVIPQRDLRNNVSEVLRRAEAGERIVVTVGGRPVAELGPVSGARRRLTLGELADLTTAALPDAAWGEDLARMRDEDAHAAEEPWADGPR